MSALTSALSSAWTLAFEYSPIFFTGGSISSFGGSETGSFGQALGGAWTAASNKIGIPIIAVTQAITFAGNIDIPNQPFFAWRPLPGGTMWSSDIAEFPFFTNQIAAISQIQQPLKISMLGHCPASSDTPFTLKLATMTALQAIIQTHVNNGGTFTVVTPSYVYTDCLLTQMIDVSGGETNQSQVSWQLDFVQPLLTFPEGSPLDVTKNNLTTGGNTNGNP
jgi:hypothetical protein